MQWLFTHPLKQPCKGQSKTGSMQIFVAQLDAASSPPGPPSETDEASMPPSAGASPQESSLAESTDALSLPASEAPSPAAAESPPPSLPVDVSTEASKLVPVLDSGALSPPCGPGASVAPSTLPVASTPKLPSEPLDEPDDEFESPPSPVVDPASLSRSEESPRKSPPHRG
jgi:hypothetical protein